MDVQQSAVHPSNDGNPMRIADLSATAAAVMGVLNGIRRARPDGTPYDAQSGLADAGFSSMDMVKVMLGVEAAFDIMIPQDLITPENFKSAETISAMIARIVPA